MALWSKPKMAKEPEKTPEAPAASKADLDRLATLMEGLVGTVSKLAESQAGLSEMLSVASQPREVPPPAIVDATDEDIDRALAEGKGAKIFRTLVQATEERIRREVTSQMAATQDAVGHISSRLASTGNYPHLDRVRAKVEGEIQNLPAQFKSNPRLMEVAFKKAYDAAVGEIHETLRAEAVEAALRKSEGPPPGAPGGIVSANGETPLPSFRTVFSAGALRALRDRYKTTDDDEAFERFSRERGHESGKAFLADYLSVGTKEEGA